MATPAIKTIKVTESTHRALKVLAAQRGERVYETVARLVKESKSGIRAARGRSSSLRLLLCRNCHAQLTSADSEAGECTQCGRAL